MNKEAFVAGETIWFKAYLFTGSVQSYISKTLYVELMNEEKQSVAQLLLPLINAVGEASFVLPKNLPEGNYYLKAYTKWMLNFEEGFQAIYHVPVYNPSSSKRLTSKPIGWTASIYPESGNLLTGRENKIAVRLTAKGQLPDRWEGYVTEKETPLKKLLSFSSLNAQLATFNFRPEAGKSYVLYTNDSLGNKSVVMFEPLSAGVVLKAKQQGDQLQVEMIFQGLAKGGLNHKLVVVSHGQLVYSAIIKKDDSIIHTSIPVGKLTTGIVQLTLFNTNEKPVAERLVFLQSDTQPDVKLSTPSISSDAKGLNEWLIEADTSLRSAYAISVTDASVTPSRHRSIKSDLWLGDLSSEIHYPHWYFALDTFRLDALDALLISEKWSRFRWESILKNSFPTIKYQPENYLSYKGKAIRNGSAVKAEKLNLLFKFKDSTLQFAEVTTDSNGAFFLQNVAFYDSVQVYVQPGRKAAVKDVQLAFERENVFSPYSGALPHSPLYLRDTAREIPPAFVKRALTTLNNEEIANGNAATLKEIKITTRVKTPKEQLNEKLSSGLFNSGEQVVFDFVNEEQNASSYTHIFDWLEGRVAGLGFTVLSEPRTNPLTGTIIPAGQRIPVMRDADPTIFLDEVITDVTLIHSLSVSEIAMVKVIRGYFLGAPSGGGGSGAIAIYTKRAGLQSNEKRLKSNISILIGYASPVPFKKINYADALYRGSKSDTRQQFYWSTHLFAPSDTKARVQFYNNDFPSATRVVLTGFTNDAQPVFFEKVVKQ